MRCLGTENRLLDCSANNLGSHNCAPDQNAGVRCQGTNPATCSEGDIRLIGGTNQGRVEICYNNIWGTVCSSGWEDVDAQVVCKQLGLITVGQLIIVGINV